jgi:ABC-type sugar transport system ATPase subunit
MLALTGIRKSFGGVQALSGASLSAERGEIHALLGENGAGKSTLLKVLSGVHAHGTFTGEIRIEGRELRFDGPASARAAGVAMVHQELMLVPELSVAENLFLGREPLRAGFLDDLAQLRDARRLLERFGLAHLDAEAPAGALGIGQQQMIEIARALAIGARILILDEPTAALAPAECERLFTWLRELRAGGTTCLYVSHRLDEVFALCDRLTVLRDGRTIETLAVRDCKPSRVVALMVGRELPVVETPAASATGEPLLEVDGLSVPGALHEVSFSLAAGEALGVGGAMGSGRTALLSTLFGCARGRVSGRVTLGGRPLPIGSPRDAIAAGVALMPEDRKGRGLVLGLSSTDNLSLPALARGGFFVDDLAEEAAAEVRIAALRVRRAPRTEAGALSGGNQQKLVLGKWLALSPKLLLLDEPTRGVDVGAREEIYALLDALRAHGTALLVASSDLAELRRLCARVLVLRAGRVAGELSGARVTESDIVGLSTGAGLAREAQQACA